MGNQPRRPQEDIDRAVGLLVEAVITSDNTDRADRVRGWPGAVLRITMRRYDYQVNHRFDGLPHGGYNTECPAKLLEEFKAHPVAKEYGYANDDAGTTGVVPETS